MLLLGNVRELEVIVKKVALSVKLYSNNLLRRGLITIAQGLLLNHLTIIKVALPISRANHKQSASHEKECSGLQTQHS